MNVLTITVVVKALPLNTYVCCRWTSCPHSCWLL